MYAHPVNNGYLLNLNTFMHLKKMFVIEYEHIHQKASNNCVHHNSIIMAAEIFLVIRPGKRPTPTHNTYVCSYAHMLTCKGSISYSIGTHSVFTTQRCQRARPLLDSAAEARVFDCRNKLSNIQPADFIQLYRGQNGKKKY